MGVAPLAVVNLTNYPYGTRHIAWSVSPHCGLRGLYPQPMPTYRVYPYSPRRALHAVLELRPFGSINTSCYVPCKERANLTWYVQGRERHPSPLSHVPFSPWNAPMRGGGGTPLGCGELRVGTRTRRLGVIFHPRPLPRPIYPDLWPLGHATWGMGRPPKRVRGRRGDRKGAHKATVSAVFSA